MILNLADAPPVTSPLERLIWLNGVAAAVKREMDEQWRATYFEARLRNMLEPAVGLGLHSRKAVLAYTRAENERRGRMVRRWPDAGV